MTMGTDHPPARADTSKFGDDGQLNAELPGRREPLRLGLN